MAGSTKRIRELRRFLEKDGHKVEGVEQTGVCHLRADIRRDTRCAS